MKTLKLALCFLFATIVSNNCFSQDTTFYTYATVVFENSIKYESELKVVDSYLEIVKVVLKKENIIFDSIENTQYDSLYHIIQHSAEKEGDYYLDTYECTDTKDIVCFVVFKKTKDKLKSIQILYTNVSFVYLVAL